MAQIVQVVRRLELSFRVVQEALVRMLQLNQLKEGFRHPFRQLEDFVDQCTWELQWVLVHLLLYLEAIGKTRQLHLYLYIIQLQITFHCFMNNCLDVFQNR